MTSQILIYSDTHLNTFSNTNNVSWGSCISPSPEKFYTFKKRVMKINEAKSR